MASNIVMEDSFDDLIPVEPLPAFAPGDRIRGMNRFLVYKLEPKANGSGYDKAPYNPRTSQKANNPALGVSIHEADAYCKEHEGFQIGLYIQEQETPDVVVIDLDECINKQTGTVELWAAEIVRSLNSYTEVSPSNSGIHIFVRGVKPGTACRRGFECYSRGRFISLTGTHVDGTPDTINECDLKPIYEQMLRGEFQQPEATQKDATDKPRTMNEVVHHHGAITTKLALLMTGEFAENSRPFTVSDEGVQNDITFSSQSEAIGSLLGCLAIKHDGDAEKMEEEFLQSSLYQGISKWNCQGGKWERLGKNEIESAVKKYQASKPVTQNVVAPVTDISDWRVLFTKMGSLQTGGAQMLIENILPEGLSMIGALPGNCKTLFALSISKALTTGTRFLGRFNVPRPTHVLYLTPESSGAAFRKRCEKFDIPDSEMFLCRTISQGATLLMDDPAVRAAVTALKPLVILDTAIRFNQSTDENSSSGNKKFVDDAQALISLGARGILGLHHATKSSRVDGLTLESALRGTGDLAAMCDSVYGLKRNDALYDEGRGPVEIEIICLKPRDFEPPPPFTIAASVKVEDKIISHIDTKRDFVLLDAGEIIDDLNDRFVKFVVADPDISMGELAEKLGIKKYKIQRIAKKAGYRKTKGSGWVLSSVKIGISNDPITLKEIAA